MPRVKMIADRFVILREIGGKTPAPPPAGAQRAVYDMYFEASYWRWAASYGYLSEGKQEEMGSVANWRDQFEGGINHVDYPATPKAELAGDEARVRFGVVLYFDSREPERINGTWVCVNEGGEWKLDHLEEREEEEE